MTMTRTWLAACVVLATSATALPAAADEWNDRTLLTFSAPVMVPGVTLQPGTYEFALADPMAARHTVRIRRQGGDLITIAQAVPIKRREPASDVTVTFNPTDGGPVALKAWYYPNSAYGHQFIYGEDDARRIASRSKTLVLSGATMGDGGRGTLYTVNPQGVRGTWQDDTAALGEWEQWRKRRGGQAARAAQSAAPNDAANEATKDTQGAQPATGSQGTSSAGTRDGQGTRGTARTAGDTPTSGAPMVQGDFKGTRVELDTLEDAPNKYIGQAISVDGKVERVLGPRLFTLDEPNWIDTEGEVLVFVRSPMAALVREDDRITVSGTMRPFVEADLEREWGWLGMGDRELTIRERPVLLAERVVGGTNQVAMLIDVRRDGAEAGSTGASGSDAGTGGGAAATGTAGTVGGTTSGTTSGAAASGSLSSIAELASGSGDLVGRPVRLQGVKVAQIVQDGGFFVNSGGRSVFVLPHGNEQAPSVKQGDTVSVTGRVFQMPAPKARQLRAGGAAHADVNDDIYVLATRVQK